ncbi:RES domain-containing protein [Mesorhizobium sp.]|uniref:RES domain-containing protein n=1 Tax=Mesorhizobium sp. TaxID=1871066 RepID=UPI00338D9956
MRAVDPGLGRRSRFAPLELGKIPTQYAATSFECAVHETIFHDIPFDESDKTVGTDSIKPLNHAVVRLKRALVLVPLFTPDLARWNITRQDLIDTTAFYYPITGQWAWPSTRAALMPTGWFGHRNGAIPTYRSCFSATASPMAISR